MKHNLTIKLIIIFFAFISISCTRIEGKWNDIIKLSAKQATFQANGDSIEISTKGEWWWITDISVNNDWYYNFQNINREADSYKIIQDCFIVERRNKQILFIKVDTNKSNAQRIITVGLEAGDYFDRVTITQKPN
jgi:hypothetical protein